MKKAQVQQIFVYVLGVVMMGLIVLFAFKGIKSITSTAESADMESFKTDFRNMIDEMSAYGRGRVDNVDIPGDYKFLCLIDKSNAPKDPNSPNSNPGTGKDLVDTSVEAGSDNNVYLVSASEDDLEAFEVDAMQVKPSSKCFDVGLGSIKLKTEGKTTSTVVQEVVSS